MSGGIVPSGGYVSFRYQHRVSEVDAEKRIHAIPTCGRADGRGCFSPYWGDFFDMIN
jgi:hypothetical protein